MLRRPERSPQRARRRTSPCGSRLYRTVKRITKLHATDTILGTTYTSGLLCRTARRGTVTAGQSLVRLSTRLRASGSRHYNTLSLTNVSIKIMSPFSQSEEPTMPYLASTVKQSFNESPIGLPAQAWRCRCKPLDQTPLMIEVRSYR